MKKLLLLIPFLYLGTSVQAALYVAPDGNDANTGTLASPFKTIPRAITTAVPGDTIYIRGSIYELTTTISIGSAKNGSANMPYCLWGYPGETPVLDFSKQPFGSKGISLRASYWHLKDLIVRGAGDNGLYIGGGSHNIVENCSFFENRDSGVQLDSGASHNRMINCDSYHNADPTDYGDADGFAPKLTVGTGNYFYGCRAWGNCDDGWDGYMRGATDVTTTLEQCWTWGNGYLKNGSDPGPQANGNGFKMGGGDNSNSEQLMHHFILRHCLAFNNKAKGFDQNNNTGSMTLLQCSGFANRTANYRISKTLSAGQTLVVKNCLSHDGSVELGGFAVQQSNSWLPPFQVSAADFISIDPALAAAPRNTDGSLPDIPFLRLAPGSDLIDGGTDLGLPFFGPAPDLGAFESNYATRIAYSQQHEVIFSLKQNFPNPFNPSTQIGYTMSRPGHATLQIFNIRGEWVTTLIDGHQAAGEHQVIWRPANAPAGIYFCRLSAAGHVEVKRLLLQK